MKKMFISFVILTNAFLLSGQETMDKDSLLRLLPKAKEDTIAVQLYINLGQQYESNEPETAKSYYIKAGDLSRKIKYPRGIIQYINNFTYLLNVQGLYDSSLALNLQGVEIARKTKDSLNLAKTLFNTGTSYRCLEEYENAVRYYEEGKKLFEKFGNKQIEAQCLDILQVLYYYLKNYPKAIELGEKAVSESRELKDLTMLGTALNNLGISYSSVDNYDTAAKLFAEALEIGNKIDDKYMQASQYLNLGDISINTGEYEHLKTYMLSALKLAQELKSSETELIAIKGLSIYYTYKKDYEKAEKYAKDALSISYLHDYKNQRVKVFTQLSNLAYARQDMHLGEYYSNQSSMLEDSILNETIQKNTLELEKKYESEKKQHQIDHLEVEKKIQELLLQKKSRLNLFLVGGFFALAIISLLYYRNLRHKQKLQQFRINELETEKQLEATEAVLKGEEQERTRLAKDLHDGLGGMLSGIKYSFTTMKENLIMTPDNQQAFERSMDMLDSSIKEMRRVAHNMMPETLVRFGLDTALKDFCSDINLSGALNVTYQSMGMESIKLEQTLSITLYRIVQELLNNTMKHAKASSAIVQLNKSNDLLSITVEDNGMGFDTSLIKMNNGIGWTNIQNRVEFLKGTLDITSREGEGTSVQIEVNI
jgi:two-component system, NarL family, sensor kinase